MRKNTSFNDRVTINLGFDPSRSFSETGKSKSITRAWRRLSSLQRTVILLLVCVACMCAVYYSPVFQMEVGRPRAQTKDHPIDMLPPGWKPPEAPRNPVVMNSGNRDEEEAKVVDFPLKVDKEEKQEQIHNPMENKPADKPLADQQVEVDKSNGPGRRFEAVVEYDYFNSNRQNNAQQKAIIEAFKECWEAYKKHAWGHDEFHPISKRFSEWFGVGLTIIDSIDTAIIMGLKDEYEEAREFVAKDLSLDRDQDVNLFEITIRVLGGMLSSYHLTGDNLFKEKAKELGDRLLPCFNSPSRVPYSDVNLRSGVAHAPRWGPDSSTSEVTTIQLEFRDLSAVTGDPKYREAVDEVYSHVHSEPKKDGLVPIFINAQTGKLRNSATISVGARGDSYYEYLLKQWLQTGKTEDKYKFDYLEAVNGMKQHLFKKSEPSKLTYLGELIGGRSFAPKMDHLVCFMGGTLALGQANGLPDDHLDLGSELTRTCYEMYARMPTKLSPEIVYFNQAEGASEDLIVKPLDSHNLLRPETVESLFYLYRITQDEKYREWGWKIFLAFKKYARVEGFGYSSINNVKNAGGNNYRDKLESFFLAETLKYLYLLFSDDPDLIPLDKFVINTEAHPLPIYSKPFSN
ncbi:endoplasmic reticulum mannosyl-oligosaccharide 1,2-alpha-mannosidase-like [Mya arenaria]|uniref:endoplasmic reticulum mannosyl-oligosaccharide 1,2-alpha-mannosidase-like n=1 Tax=Mya arenaria TaxID=6604 RepID=UPI0022E90F81|nr:endoplasmic reticulum mannosyl-oligosaccharide 1,2-alpha-mannosidase-like [Mya arenaria]